LQDAAGTGTLHIPALLGELTALSTLPSTLLRKLILTRRTT
jgi:hypothetical protein